MAHPTCTTPVGGTVKITIPAGWYTYASGLSRNTYNQMIRIRYTEGEITNTEYLNSEWGEPNDTMKLRRTREGSFTILCSEEVQTIELAAYFSTNRNIKDRLLEKPENNAGSKSIKIVQAQTPPHLHDDFPDYVTFFVFVQDSATQIVTNDAPLYNDAVCTINVIKGTGLGHNGKPLDQNDEIESGGETGTGGDTGTNGGTEIGGGTGAGGIGTDDGRRNGPALDLLFLQDCTASQGPYIKSATDSIFNISSRVATSGKFTGEDFRVGLVAFRDYGDDYVTKSFRFTSDISEMQRNLKTLSAGGGGDGPEAITEALDAAITSGWRVNATKIVILITDSPPHGIGEPGDGSPGGSPTGDDPLTLARRMASLGITLHLIACEPTLSNYKYAVDFYRALTKITGGQFLPLISTPYLADYIVGSTLEVLEMNALVSTYGKDIARRALYKGETAADLTTECHKTFSNAGIAITKLEIEPIYNEYPEGAKNVETYKASETAVLARPLSEVPGFRLLPKFFNGRVSPAVTVVKNPITLEQTSRVVSLSINRNAEIGPGEKVIARPSNKEPVGNSVKVYMPAGWFAFFSGLSRAAYNQVVKLQYTEDDITNTEFLLSRLGSTDDIMRLKRTREGFFCVTSDDDINIKMEASFFWTRGNAKGAALAKKEYSSQKLKLVETQTPLHLRDDFPDYVTYFIMGEDQVEAEQVAGVPEYNDIIGVFNLIRSTPMVFIDVD